MSEEYISQCTKVNNLKLQIQQQSQHLVELNKTLEIETSALQRMCTHVFYRESDGDYHRPCYYYVCTKCGHWCLNSPFTIA